MHQRRHVLQALGAATALASGLPLRAFADAAYPAGKPVKIIATYQPGGTNDIMARLAAQIWSEALGVPVTVENRPGANGNLGTELVARAKGDGHTLLAGNFGPIVTSPTLYPDLPYDPLKDFAPVGILASVPNVIAVHPSSPARTLPEFIALAKSRAAKPPRFGIVVGGTPQFLVENLKRATGITLQNVQYKGGTSALNDLIGNHIDLYIDNVPAMLPQVRGGTIRALAVAADERSPVLPDVPTTRELGYPDAVISAWHGILAPTGTPPAVVQKLNQTLVAALRSPAITERIVGQGGQVVANTPEQFSAFLRSEITRWATVIRSAGIAAPV